MKNIGIAILSNNIKKKKILEVQKINKQSHSISNNSNKNTCLFCLSTEFVNKIIIGKINDVNNKNK
jgi:hypothetical protein